MTLKFLKAFISLFIFTLTTPAQDFSFNYSFGKFSNASSFYMNSAGFLFITDSGTDKVYKYDSLGIYIQETGGFGWGEAAFDDPVDVYATPLNVYVSDKNNHRIQRFDKDLNFISQLYTRENDRSEERFGFPLGCAVSGQGDFFILDSENKRVLKFDLFGNFIQTIGGIDAGIYSLSNPTKLAASLGNQVFVIDDNKVVVFDNYGNGMGILEMEIKLHGIRIISNYLCINSKEEIFIADLRQPALELNKINFGDTDIKLISAIRHSNNLYILTEKEVLVFRITL
jgi:hypothetical protein